MINEKFIQDAFTNPTRITKVLREMDIAWESRDGSTGTADTVTQEFSFAAKGEGGRIDVLATFENRTKLVICEVKLGTVGDVEAEQLQWYVDNWIGGNATIADDTVSDIRAVAGILLAEGFNAMSDEFLNHPHLHFVKFDRNATGFPFSVESPQLKVEEHEEEATPAKSYRQSWLWLAEDKSEHFSTEVKNAFEGWLSCFLDADDSRHQWIVTSIKNSHISIHYKSEYITVLYPRKKSFVGNFGRGEINGDFSSKDDLTTIKPRIHQILAQIDEDYRKIIPPGRSW